MESHVQDSSEVRTRAQPGFTSVLNACRQLSFVLLEDKLYNLPFVTKQGRQLFLRLGLELIWWQTYSTKASQRALNSGHTATSDPVRTMQGVTGWAWDRVECSLSCCRQQMWAPPPTLFRFLGSNLRILPVHNTANAADLMCTIAKVSVRGRGTHTQI